MSVSDIAPTTSPTLAPALPARVRALAAQLAGLFEQDQQIVLRLNDAHHLLTTANERLWTDPAAGSQIEFDSFVHLAHTAERGLFDFIFLAEGLRLREHRGRAGGPPGRNRRSSR